MILDPVHSVSNFAFYQGVPKKSVGATIGYIAYLGLIFAFAVALSLHLKLRPRIEEAVQWAATSVPRLVLANGKLQSDLTAPLLLRHPKVQELAIVIDTNRVDAVSPAEMNEKKLVAYLTQNAFYVMNNGKMEARNLAAGAADAKPLVIDSAFWQMVGMMIAKILFPVAFISTWLVFLPWKHISALIYSILGLLINGVASGKMDFAAIYKTSVYAQTPVIVLQLASLFFPRPIPFFTLLGFLLTGLYLWVAIRQQSDAAAPAEPQTP